MGSNRRYAGSFFDYFRLILDFETVRAARFGIDHYAAVSLNPKEAEDAKLADEVISGLTPYLQHPRCVAVGEIGFNNITPNEERAFARQLEIAEAGKHPVIVHLPHTDKVRGIRRCVEMIRSMNLAVERIVLDHNTEDTIAISRDSGCYSGMTVYPISKLSPERVSNIIRRYGADRMIVNGSADWGVSDPLSLVKVVERMRADGHAAETIRRIVFGNANAFYGQSPNWRPNLDLTPLDPREFQR
jgi:predicted metal-dependent TIM-barrel fold hydrolase